MDLLKGLKKTSSWRFNCLESEREMVRSLFKFLYWLSGMLVLLLVFDFGSRVLRAAPQDEPADTASLRVSVAVLVTPRMADGAAWDIGHGADIVLCGTKGCYVSEGLDKPATFYEDSGAFRLLKKAGACRDHLTCVFRAVDLGKLNKPDDPEAYIQLIDVDYVSHNYMSKISLTGPMVCDEVSGRFSCEGGVHKRTFSLWAIDEGLAARAKRDGLDQVLFHGLPEQRISAMTASIRPLREEIKASTARFYQLIFGKTVPDHCLSDTRFLSETFFVTGLSDAKQRRAEPLIRSLTGEKPVDALRELVQRSPQIYWGFVDIAKQLRDFSLAREARLDEEVDGLSLDGQEAGLTLTYGWRIKARAKAALTSCAARNAALIKTRPPG